MTQLLRMDHSEVYKFLPNPDCQGSLTTDRIMTLPRLQFQADQLYLEDAKLVYASTGEKIVDELEEPGVVSTEFDGVQPSQEELDRLKAKQALSEKAYSTFQKLNREVLDLFFTVKNIQEMTYIREKRGSAPYIKSTEKAEGLALMKRLEADPPMPPHIEIQKIFGVKKHFIEKCVNVMDRQAKLMRERLEVNRAKLKELTVYSKSSSVVIERNKGGNVEVALNIYSPELYQKKGDRREYILPVTNLEENYKKKKQGLTVMLEIVLNLRKVKRLRLTPRQLVFHGLLKHESAVTDMLLDLGEMRMFKKLQGLFETKRDDFVLYSIDQLISIKVRLTDEQPTDFDPKDPVYHFLRYVFHKLSSKLLSPLGYVKNREFRTSVAQFIESKFNSLIFDHFIDVFFAIYKEPQYILLPTIKMTWESDVVTLEFYHHEDNTKHSFPRKFMFVDKLIVRNNQLLSELMGTAYSNKQIHISQAAEYIRFIFASQF